MNRSLNFKIILIMVVFIIIVMCVVETVLLANVLSYYSESFVDEIDAELSDGKQLPLYLISTLEKDTEKDGISAASKSEMQETLSTYFSRLGININRNIYILDKKTNIIYTSGSDMEEALELTPNLIAALNKKTGNTVATEGTLDYAIYLEGGEDSVIIYVKDTQEEVREINSILFSIVVQAILFGLLVAVILSLLLSKAISSPIQRLDRAVQTIAAGDFSQKIEITSNDEIGTLTENFNKMSEVLENTIEEVKTERGKLETVFSYLKDAVIAFSADGRIININESAKELFSIEKTEDFTFRSLLSLLSDADAAEDDDFAPYSDTVQNIVYKDKVFEAGFGKITYTDSGMQNEGVIAVIHDITDRYALDTAQREFVANVSHELRTPLTSIKGACETILEHPDMPPALAVNFLNMAVEESDRMTRIVQDLLILSRLDNKRTRWEVSEYSLAASVTRVCEIMTVDASSHKHILQQDIKDVGSIVADRQKIEQVLINIISNSIKYTKHGGIITVSTSEEGDNVKITVKDNGIGIPEDDLSHIFERFYRVEKSRTSETGGTGLGLAIAKEITEAHGGYLTITSALGRGTKVDITLPKRSPLMGSGSAI